MCQFVLKVEENGHKWGVPFAIFILLKARKKILTFFKEFFSKIKINKRLIEAWNGN